jgi:hypothetical protein
MTALPTMWGTVRVAGSKAHGRNRPRQFMGTSGQQATLGRRLGAPQALAHHIGRAREETS